MRFGVILVTLWLVAKSIQKLESYEEKVAPVKQLLCAKQAIRRYVVDDSRVIVFSKKPDNIVNSLFKVPLFVITKWNPRIKTLFDGKGTMVIFLEGKINQDFESLRSLQGSIMTKPVLLVCITDGICASDDYMEEIIEMVTSAELHYVAINERGIIDMYKYTTTGEGHCGKAQFIRCGHCSDKSIAKMLLPKAVNFHQCPIRVITHFYPPYSEPCDQDDLHQVCGIEGNVVELIAKAVNATLVVLSVQTPTDLKQLVAKRYGDLGFGQLHARSHEGISLAMAHTFVKATVMAPRSFWVSTKSLKYILLPFENEVWIGIGVTVVLVFILQFLVSYFRVVQMLQLFGMFLGIPVPRQPRALSGRTYFITLMLFGYFCSQAYLTHLAEVLVTLEQRMIKTLDDLEKSDILVSGPAAKKQAFQDYPRIYKDYQGLEFPDYYTKFLNLLIGRYHSALYVEGSDYNFAEWKSLERLDDISWFPVAMIMPNSSAIMKITNKVLFSIIESGIFNEFVIIHATKHQFLKHRGFRSEQELVIRFHDFLGVLSLLIAGLILSFYVFVIEILTAFIKNRGWLKWRNLIRQKLLRQRPVDRILRQRHSSPSRRN